MSSVGFAQSDNPLPLGDKGYDKIFLENRLSTAVGGIDGIKNTDTGSIVKNIFVNPTTGGPSDVVINANIIIGVFALLYLAFAAAQFIISRGEEEGLDKAKKNIGYIILGLLVVAASNTIIFTVLDPSGAKDFLTGNQVSDGLINFINQAKVFIQIIIGAIAAFALLISGYQLITSQGNDEVITKEKEFVKHFLLAAGLIAFAEVLVRGVFYARRDGQFDSNTALEIGIAEIVGVINFLLSFVAVAAVFMLVLASFYYVVSVGDEDRTGRAKRIIFSSIIGIALAISAFTLITYFTQF